MADEKLDRTGRRLVAVGVLIVEPLALLALLGAAWFVTQFSDDCVDRALDCAVELWPIWVVALAIGVIVVLAMARVVIGGTVALMMGTLAGLSLALVGLWQLVRGGLEPIRALIVVSVIVGGLSLGLGSAARLRARSARRQPTERQG